MSAFESATPPSGPLSEPSLSPIQRAAAVFTRPASAWTGLRHQAQWWFPMLVLVTISVAGSLAVYHRAVVPMQMEQMDEQVANGQMTREQADRAESFMSGGLGVGIAAASQLIVLPIVYFLAGAIVWFGVGFVLGDQEFKYRHGLEVVCWSGLVSVPATLLTTAMAWSRETMKGIHLGFGVLLPDMDPPSKLHTALGVVLDSLGPLSIWYLVVGILGASALSRAPRKSVGLVVGVLYFAITLFGAGMAALFTPGS